MCGRQAKEKYFLKNTTKIFNGITSEKEILEICVRLVKYT